VQTNSHTVNVETESATQGSLLRFYRDLLKIRRSTPALTTGDYVPLNASDENTMTYLRKAKAGDATVLVVLNMSDKPQTVEVHLAQAGVVAHSLKELLVVSAEAAGDAVPAHIRLQPFGIYVGEVR
jgi:glycosidase